MLFEDYFFINHIYLGQSSVVNLLCLVVFLLVLGGLYLYYNRRGIKITDILWKSVIFFTLIFGIILMVVEVGWLYKDIKELGGKDYLDKVSVMHNRFSGDTSLVDYIVGVKEYTKPGSTAIFVSPLKFEEAWLKYYLFPHLELLIDDHQAQPDYFLVFGVSPRVEGLILIKEFSSTEKIYATSSN